MQPGYQVALSQNKRFRSKKRRKLKANMMRAVVF
jgi:hypothetical protein